MSYRFWYHVDGPAEGVIQVKHTDTRAVVYLERADLSKSETRSRVAQAIAQRTGLPVQAVEAELTSQAAEEEEKAGDAAHIPQAKADALSQAPPQNPSAGSRGEPGSEARKEAERMLERLSLLAEIADPVNILGVTGEWHLISQALTYPQFWASRRRASSKAVTACAEVSCNRPIIFRPMKNRPQAPG